MSDGNPSAAGPPLAGPAAGVSAASPPGEG